MSGCATPATQSAAASQAPKPVQARHPVPSVARLPRKTTVDVTLCHACHVKQRWMSGCATPATQSAAASQAPKPVQGAPPSAICRTPATQNDGGCDFVPRVPREMKVDVRLCHACHAKCRGVTGAQAGPSAPPSAMGPTPATQNDGGCDFVPRLPREMKVDVRLCHACHAKCRGVTCVCVCVNVTAPKPVQARHPVPSVARLPRKTTVDVTLCQACHVK